MGQEGVDQDDDDSDKRDPKQGEDTSTTNRSWSRGEGLVRSPLLLAHEWLVCCSVRLLRCLLVCAMRLLVRSLMRSVCLLVCLLRLLPRLHRNLPLGWANPLGVAGVTLDSRHPERNV
jgi:hypothetical protein